LCGSLRCIHQTRHTRLPKYISIVSARLTARAFGLDGILTMSTITLSATPTKSVKGGLQEHVLQVKNGRAER
jgi:hypothetical protein